MTAFIGSGWRSLAGTRRWPVSTGGANENHAFHSLMDTPWSRAKANRASETQERRLGEMPEGKKQVNSGRLWRWKRDGIVWNFLVEARTTKNGSYRIDKKEFQSVRREAITTPPGLKPAMQVDLDELQLWVMELHDWEAVYTRLIDLESRLGEYTDSE